MINISQLRSCKISINFFSNDYLLDSFSKQMINLISE